MSEHLREGDCVGQVSETRTLKQKEEAGQKALWGGLPGEDMQEGG